MFPVHIERRAGAKKGKCSQKLEDEFYEKHGGAGPQLVFLYVDTLCDWMSLLRPFPVMLSAPSQMKQLHEIRQWNG